MGKAVMHLLAFIPVIIWSAMCAYLAVNSSGWWALAFIFGVGPLYPEIKDA